METRRVAVRVGKLTIDAPESTRTDPVRHGVLTRDSTVLSEKCGFSPVTKTFNILGPLSLLPRGRRSHKGLDGERRKKKGTTDLGPDHDGRLFRPLDPVRPSHPVPSVPPAATVTLQLPPPLLTRFCV